MIPFTLLASAQPATSGDSGSGWATGIIVAVVVILILIPGVIAGRRALAAESQKSPEELERLNPRLSLRGHWGPGRIGFLGAAVLFGIAIWRSQGPLIALVAVGSGLLVAGICVVIERRALRKLGWRPPSEREQ
jgi:hypothetical protein